MSHPVRIASGRGVMTATLADEEGRNALGPDLVQGLRDAIAAAAADPKIRALLVTNVGSTFCAGANLKQRSGASPRSSSSSGSGGFEELLHEIQTCPKPIVGRIAGHVVGGGNGLAAALDISIAADDVKFGFSEVRLGVAPAIISVVCLPKMRPGEAMEAFLRGHRFSAARAAELGLITRAVPAAQLDAAVEEVLADLKKSVYDEDLIAIVTEEVVRAPDRFELLELNVTSSSTTPPHATVRLRVDGQQLSAEGDGDGMVDACYKVISRMTGVQAKLERYAVKAITGGTDALGEVSCLIQLDGVTVTGQGAHTDIIQASALAYINALNKLEYRRQHYHQMRSEGP